MSWFTFELYVTRRVSEMLYKWFAFGPKPSPLAVVWADRVGKEERKPRTYKVLGLDPVTLCT